VDGFRAERVDGERGRDGGVDPAGEADDDLAESVLADSRSSPSGASGASWGSSRSTTSNASSKPGARARTVPSLSMKSECPSKISSSWPPTALQSATRTSLSLAREAKMPSRSCARPTWKGEAERFTISSAPAAASSVVGGPGIHMSSQIVIPTFVPATSTSAGSLPDAK
jgi:hypothetical protein